MSPPQVGNLPPRWPLLIRLHHVDQDSRQLQLIK